MKTRDQFIANERTVPEIAEFITADSLGYLSLKGLISALKHPRDDVCIGCLTGEDPVTTPRPPPATSTMTAAGVTNPGTGPNDTLYVPGGIDCHTCQSSYGSPFTKIVPGTGGPGSTRGRPWGRR